MESDSSFRWFDTSPGCFRSVLPLTPFDALPRRTLSQQRIPPLTHLGAPVQRLLAYGMYCGGILLGRSARELCAALGAQRKCLNMIAMRYGRIRAHLFPASQRTQADIVSRC